jgi:hypothetical protein
MPRFALPLLLLASAAVAAPVPKVVLSAEQEKEFNTLWDTRGERASAQLRYYCRLVSQPDAGVEYIRRLVKPAEMSEKEAKAIITDLGSKDEVTAKRAYRDLRYRDIRLAMTLSDAWELAAEESQQVRLAFAVFGLGWPSEGTSVRLLPPERGEASWKLLTTKAGTSSIQRSAPQTYDEQIKAEKGYDEKSPLPIADWVAFLERTDTPAARKHLEALATAREGAKTTRYAMAARDRLRVKPRSPSPDLDAAWLRKWYPFTKPDAANVFLDAPDEAVLFLKKKLRPVKLNQDVAKQLLTDLFGDDKKKVLAAVRELQVVDLQLENDFADLWVKADTPTKRCRLVDTKMLWDDQPYNAIPDDFDIDERNTLRDYERIGFDRRGDDPVDAGVNNRWRDDVPMAARKGDSPAGGQSFAFLSRKGETHSDRWYHEESAIYILDAIGTDDALAIVKDMATGHPDAGPTKAAKEVLKRRGIK